MMPVVSSRKIPPVPDHFMKSWQKVSQLILVPNPHYPGKTELQTSIGKIIGGASVACSSPVATLTLPMRCRWINSTP